MSQAPMVPQIRIRTAAEEKMLKRCAHIAVVEAPFLMRQRAGAFGRALAAYTQPVIGVGGTALTEAPDASGTSAAARRLGEGAVRRDVARVYATMKMLVGTIRTKVGPQAARAFQSLLRRDRAKALALLQKHGIGVSGAISVVDGFDDGAAHRAARNSRGRVSRSQASTVVTDERALKAHEKRKVANVGYTKSAFLTAAGQIKGAEGLGKAPAWIRRHKAPGLGLDRTRRPQGPQIVLRSGVKWADTATNPRYVRQAEFAAMERLDKELVIRLRKISRSIKAQTTKPRRGR